MTRSYALLAVVAIGVVGVVAVTVRGRGGDPSPEAAKLLEDKASRADVDRLSEEVRSLEKRLARVDREVQDLGNNLAKSQDDLRSRLKEMVQQERSGRRRFPVRPHIEVRVEEKPYMGFDAQDLLPDVAEHLKLKARSGVLVTEVRPGAPAAVAGLKQNDVIQGLDDAKIKDFKDLKKALGGKKPNQVVTLAVLRGDEKLVLKIKLGVKKVRVGG